MNNEHESPLPVPFHGERPGEGAMAESRRRAALWDLVVRAHYLAHDMREGLGNAAIPSAALGHVLSALLADWATEFGAALEHAEVNRAVDRADARLRDHVVGAPSATNDR